MENFIFCAVLTFFLNTLGKHLKFSGNFTLTDVERNILPVCSFLQFARSCVETVRFHTISALGN